MFAHGADVKDFLDAELCSQLRLGGVVEAAVWEKAARAIDEAGADSDFAGLAIGIATRGRRSKREETEVAGVESSGDVEEGRGGEGGEDGFFGDGLGYVCFREGDEVGSGEGWKGHFDGVWLWLVMIFSGEFK